MLFQSISSEKDAQALDLLIIVFLMLFTVAMFMQFGLPGISSVLGNNQVKTNYSSIFGQ